MSKHLLMRVPASGRAPEMLVPIRPTDHDQLFGPQLLPGGKALLFTSAAGGDFASAGKVVVQSIASGERTVVVDGGAADARYLPAGHILYVKGGVVYAMEEEPMIKRGILTAAILLVALSIRAADEFPGATWNRVKSLSQAGWSAQKLKAARAYSATLDTDAVMIVDDGLVVDEWGATSTKIVIHSIRKSYMSALYGIFAAKGEIQLSKTLAQLGIDDRPPLTVGEKQATIEDLLKARSGVYHQALEETASMQEKRPERGSHPHGTYWYYNNWDFNALGTIFEKVTGKKIFEEVKRQLALPLQMQDFEVTDGRYDRGPQSIHAAYPMEMTARDMARFGLLYLHEGNWRGKQIIPSDWVRRSITAYSRAGSMGGYGYLWWVAVKGRLFTDVTVEEGSFAAEGVGGNYIVVIPARKLVVVHRVETKRGRKVSNAQFGHLLAMILDAQTKH